VAHNGRGNLRAKALEETALLGLNGWMTSLRLTLLICVAVVGITTTSVRAQTAGQGDDRPPLTVPQDCTWDSARALTVEEIANDYLAFYGQCVRTRGVSNGNSIDHDAAAFNGGGWTALGVFFQHERLPDGVLSDAEFLGVVGACEYVTGPPQTIQNPDGTTVIRIRMGSGVCHWFNEYPYLLVHEFRSPDVEH
jgi:hypothetical protein